VADSRINISQPVLDAETEALVLQVLRSGHLAQGPMVQEFESLVATMAGTKHAVAVTNGTVALEAALDVLGIGSGDEVITSPLTFSATLNAILQCGASVRFVDVGEDFTIDPSAIEAAITPRTRAVMPVHLYGLISDMEAISAITTRHGLEIIEDAAQAHGSTQNGRFAGSFGLGCFSFYATKNVTSGEGGMVTTSNSELAEHLRVLRNQGMKARYEYTMIGQNWRLTDLAAAVAIPQMRRLEEIVAVRNENAKRLCQLLEGSGMRLPIVPSDRTHVWHQFTILLPECTDRDEVISKTERDGVITGAYYPRMVWDYPPYRSHKRVYAGDTPQAASIASRCLSLPVHPQLSEADLERVASTVCNAVQTRIT
jgi:dTDP-4-amino-4,6-dideoxygalactose transaminase